MTIKLHFAFLAIAVENPSHLIPSEEGWQDTIWVTSGEAVSIKANFDLEGLYVWHCHILSHEDHDMMRSFSVVARSE